MARLLSAAQHAAPVETKQQRGIQSVEVGARLLDVLAKRREPLALSALADAAAMSTAQAHTYLVSLTRLGLVKRDALTGNYEPGPLALRLGVMNLEQQPAYRAAAPRVAALALETGMSVAVSVAGPQGPTIVRYERGGQPLHVNLHVGTVMSLSATATGRIFLAFDTPASVAAMQAHQAEADVPGIGARLDEIRARGIERGIDAPSPGVSSMSVPVFDAAQRMQLALTAIGPSGLCDVAWNGALAQALQQAARDLTGVLS
ncbi:helix-turn-helix domain-containing protein [Caballeronia sp. LZ034LL]|uniref:IclR family transcriptional regulator n=1 Tax=Caballeronia sp. LZ034LL TaxID=3038567 RepID=UPI0028576DA0|nr:helix-turn-helix domain-containing protein [Caballeronia sp. LZ034LL]MDR5838591.1 helix-turn-helix domain-containing protein [Caballeronia sp. LZ034LL]